MKSRRFLAADVADGGMMTNDYSPPALKITEEEITHARIALEALSLGIDKYYAYYLHGDLMPILSLQGVAKMMTVHLMPDMQALLVREMKKAMEGMK